MVDCRFCGERIVNFTDTRPRRSPPGVLVRLPSDPTGWAQDIWVTAGSIGSRDYATCSKNLEQVARGGHVPWLPDPADPDEVRKWLDSP